MQEQFDKTRTNTPRWLGKYRRDFGSQGVFFGEVVSVEYDSSDDAQEAPFNVVKYIEDMNEEELRYACELSLQIALDAEDDVAMEPGTDEDVSYRSSILVHAARSRQLLLSPALQRGLSFFRANGQGKKTSTTKKNP
jgi:hypothetical protein